MTDTTKKPTIEPLEGWTVQTPYGTLKTRSGVALVRLEDVHVWMCGKGVAVNDAVQKIFSPFYMSCLSFAEDGDTEALNLPRSLFVMNALTPPDGLVIGTNQSKVQAVKFFASAFPALGHVRLEDGSIGGLLYSMAEGALRVWHGASDISNDHLAMRKARQERALEEKYSIRWPKDEDLRKLLGRLAVPFEIANELWAWGRVVEAAGGVANVTPLHSVLEANAEPTNWPQLIKFRNTFPGTEWSIKQKNIVANEVKTRTAVPGSTGVKESMAGELGCSVTHINKLIREKDDAGKKAKTHTTAATSFPRSVSASYSKS